MPSNELCKDTSQCVDVYRFVVFGGVEDDLWGSVPTCNHVLCLELALELVATSETEIANLEVATLIEEQVAWFQVSMNDIR